MDRSVLKHYVVNGLHIVKIADYIYSENVNRYLLAGSVTPLSHLLFFCGPQALVSGTRLTQTAAAAAADIPAPEDRRMKKFLVYRWVSFVVLVQLHRW